MGRIEAVETKRERWNVLEKTREKTLCRGGERPNAHTRGKTKLSRKGKTGAHRKILLGKVEARGGKGDLFP